MKKLIEADKNWIIEDTVKNEQRVIPKDHPDAWEIVRKELKEYTSFNAGKIHEGAWEKK